MTKNITIKVVLWSRKDKNKLYPVKIRITEDRKSSYVNLGFSVQRKRFFGCFYEFL